MVAECPIDSCKKPLHDREFHSVKSIGLRMFIVTGVEHVHVITEEIIDRGLSFRLPPHMNANKVEVKHMQVQYQAYNGYG